MTLIKKDKKTYETRSSHLSHYLYTFENKVFTETVEIFDREVNKPFVVLDTTYGLGTHYDSYLRLGLSGSRTPLSLSTTSLVRLHIYPVLL